MHPSTSSTVGCLLTFDVGEPAELVLQLGLAGRLVTESLDVAVDGAAVPVTAIHGADGGRQHLLRAAPGTLTVRYDATVAAGAEPRPVRAADRIAALRPSRYCPSDRLVGFAANRFGDRPDAAGTVRAICEHVFENTRYDAAGTDSSTDAVATLLSGSGVCRDYAHLVATLCRAVNIPARVVSVYAPGLTPMDFHAVVETALDGVWRVWDATRLAPRPTLLRIATGRDAADTAFATVLAGTADLRAMEITAVAGGDLPLDDHTSPVSIA